MPAPNLRIPANGIDFTHDLRKAPRLPTGPLRIQMAAKPHPVRLETIKIVAIEEFTHQFHGVFANLPVLEVQRAVQPAAGFVVRHSP